MHMVKSDFIFHPQWLTLRPNFGFLILFIGFQETWLTGVLKVSYEDGKVKFHIRSNMAAIMTYFYIFRT